MRTIRPLESVDNREVAQLLSAPSFRASVEQVAAELGTPVEAAMQEAAGYLREMSAG